MLTQTDLKQIDGIVVRRVDEVVTKRVDEIVTDKLKPIHKKLTKIQRDLKAAQIEKHLKLPPIDPSFV